jgi:hypothetical protein
MNLLVHKLVITAAHCLPFFPPCVAASYLSERTYERLLGPIGAEATVWAECLFVDPISDLAVLGQPDNQALYEEADSYDALLNDLTPLPIKDAPEKSRAWLLSLDGQWFECVAQHSGGPLSITAATQGIRGGMSGSPIINDAGHAVGVLCLGSGRDGDLATEGGPNPRLACNLPAWLAKRRHRSRIARVAEALLASGELSAEEVDKLVRQ